MNSTYSFNYNHISPYTQIIRSYSDLHRLSLKRSHPISLEFQWEENDAITKASFKKLMSFLSKKTLKLTNPPAKEASKSGRHTRHLRSLQIKPQDAAKHISKITRRFSKLTHFAIHDEQDIFMPTRIHPKVYPMRNLKRFTYDNEFCRDFMRCAYYVRDLKIKKTSLSLTHLKRLTRLQNFYLILRTKYLSLPAEDIQFTKDLGELLLKIPSFKSLTLDQEIEIEIHSYIFMELNNVLKDRAKVNLIADVVDLSSNRNQNMSVEKIMQKIHSFGIENIWIRYAGVDKVMKVYDRLFNAPVHMRTDIYTRFLRTIMDTDFKHIHFSPSVHSSHIDYELKDMLTRFLQPSAKFKIPSLNIMYHLETIDSLSLELMEGLYDQKISSYEIIVVSAANNLRKGIAEEIDDHYTKVFSKIEQTNTSVSLRIVGRNLEILKSIMQMTNPKISPSLIKSLSVELIDPVDNNSLQGVFGLLCKFGVMRVVKQLGIDVAQKEAPKPSDLFSFLISFCQAFQNLSKINLSYGNMRNCENILKKVFEELRLQCRWVEFNYETYNEKIYRE